MFKQRLHLLPRILHSKTGFQVWSELLYKNYSMYFWLAYCGMVTQWERPDRTTVWTVVLEQLIQCSIWCLQKAVDLMDFRQAPGNTWFFQEMYSYAFQIRIILLSFGPIYLSVSHSL